MQVIQINTPGPQGPVGPQGPSGSFDNISGSFLYTSSFNAFTASYKIDSASFNTRSLNNSASIALLSGSFLTTSSSLASRSVNNSASIVSLSSSFLSFSSSYSTGSFTGSFTGIANLTNFTASNALVTGNVTVLGTASINTLVVNQRQLSTGSNQLGDAADDTQTLYGTVVVPTGSLTVTGSVIATSGFTGSLLGTSSYTPTLDQVTTAGSTTTNFITIGGLTATGSVTASGALARANYLNNTLIASANNDVLVGLDINPTINTGSFTGVNSFAARLSGQVLLSTNNAGLLGRLTGGTTINLLNVDNTNNILIGSAFNSGGNTLLYSNNNLTVYQYPSNVLTQRMTLFGVTGNLLLQNGGTFTDNGFRLDVNGTARIQNQLTTTGSITASSTYARGVYFNQTLVAAANNDSLAALEINPTFTNGSFTGVRNNWINLVGNAAINGSNQIYLRTGNVDVLFASSAETQLKSISTTLPLKFSTGTTQVGQFSGTTGNMLLQNGGTFTDNLAGLQLNHNITASSTIARGAYITTTLSASANNDVLVGLDINPTFNTGSFTGVSNIGLRIQNSTIPVRFYQVSGRSTTLEWYNNTGTTRLAYMNLTPSSDWVLQSSTGAIRLFANNTEGFRLFTTNNLAIQNGGTFTDAGYRLDVKGSTRIQGAGATSATTTLLLQNTNTSSSLLVTDDLNARFFGNVGIGTSPSSGSLHVLSAASTSSAAVYIYKSGSTTLDIQGSQGQLFSVTDQLSGSLMSVNDISGLPILEVFSDDTVVMGSFSNPALRVTGSAVIFPATASAAPTYTGSEGQVVFGLVGGNAFIYAWLGGRWRSGSLA